MINHEKTVNHCNKSLLTKEGYREVFSRWKEDVFFDPETKKELDSIKDEKDIEDRFYRTLEFGTGGLRGIMGAGTNRMNKYTVGQVTMGFGKYLLDRHGKKLCNERGIVIGYDTRNNSRLFSNIVANVLSSMGIRIYLHSFARPTPQLSFSVTYWNALAGVMITASHNPKEYNGYKIYDEYGCQLRPNQTKDISDCINTITDYHMIPFEGDTHLIQISDITDSYVNEVIKQRRLNDRTAKEELHVLYTPLHGTGYVPVTDVLKRDGFIQLEVVGNQSKPDGDFPTIISPNPEEKQVFEIGIQQAVKCNADIILATDPDSDRMGVAVKANNNYQLINGNQIGALLMDFVLEHSDLKAIKNPAVVKTIVTSELGAEIARKKGLAIFTTLTGFKYIGEKIIKFGQLESNGRQKPNYTFVFGYEESYGYLVGTHAKDKDAVVSCLLICEMAAQLKRQNKTLIDKLDEIYAEFGYYMDSLDSFTLEGKDGLEKIAYLMNELRMSGSPFENTKQVIDYNVPIKEDNGFDFLPSSNVLKFILKDDSWIAVRPSGTEPKIKIYYSIKGENKNIADIKLQKLQNTIKTRLKLS